jgi:hypothetical protein
VKVTKSPDNISSNTFPMKKLMSMLAIFIALTFAAVTASAVSYTVPVGQTLTLSVTAQGTTPFTYQWFYQAPGSTATPVAIAGATSVSYSPPKVTVANAASIAGTYTVVVSNAAGSTTSDQGIITVLLPPSNATVSATSI